MKKKEERNLQQIQTEKFSDVSVLVRSLLPLERRTITAYNLLVFYAEVENGRFRLEAKVVDRPQPRVRNESFLRIDRLWPAGGARHPLSIHSARARQGSRLYP